MLRQKNIPAFYHPIGSDTNSKYALSWTPAQNKKMRWKLILIHEVLKLGYSVLFADSDVLLLKNPFPYLYSIRGYNFIGQSEVVRICSGFMFVKPSRESLLLFEKAACSASEKVNEQLALNLALKYTNTTAFHLPRSLFAGGPEFFGKYQYYWDRKGIYKCAD